MDSIISSDSFRFKELDKKYSSNQMVSIYYIVKEDGICEFAYLKEPKNDLVLSSEASRLVALLPRFVPAMCDGKPVLYLVLFQYVYILKSKIFSYLKENKLGQRGILLFYTCNKMRNLIFSQYRLYFNNYEYLKRSVISRLFFLYY